MCVCVCPCEMDWGAEPVHGEVNKAVDLTSYDRKLQGGPKILLEIS